MNRMNEPMLQGKTHDIPKRLVWDAWLKVKENKGAAGVDGVTIERFEADLRGNLYQLWNRMSSGSYFPGPVRAVEIPKKGGTRILGIPNIVDRIAQTVVVLALEPELEKIFHDDSFGYRPGRSALDAVAVCRERCFKNDWVIDMDIKAFFDSMPWGVDAEGGRASHGLEVGFDLRGALAESPDADDRRHLEAPDNGNTARRLM
jgi:retron-type reverse transcriptase